MEDENQIDSSKTEAPPPNDPPGSNGDVPASPPPDDGRRAFWLTIIQYGLIFIIGIAFVYFLIGGVLGDKNLWNFYKI